MGTGFSLGRLFGSRRPKVLLFGGALALLISVLALATLARAEVLTDCTPYSQPFCADVPVGLPYATNFDGSGKPTDKADKDGHGTGFTMVQPSSNGGTYLPEKLDVDAGTLKATTTKGIQFKTASDGTNAISGSKGNALDNGLGVGVNAANKVTRFETTIVNPPNGSGQSEQAGLWVGTDEDNYAKLVIASTSSTQYRFQLLRERNGVSAGTTTSTSDEINTGNFTLSGKTVKLALVADATANKVTGYYSIDGGPETQVVSAALNSLTVPAGFFDGSYFNSSTELRRPIDGLTSFGGVFTTQRNRASTATPASLVYIFDDFKLSETAAPDTTPPTAPTGLVANAGDGRVALDWADNTESDLKGYNVYRSTVTPVPTTGTPLNGLTPLTGSTLTDSVVQNGTIYNYVVRAVDNAGNASTASSSANAMPDVANPQTVVLPAKINFQNEAASVPSGYTKDFGKNYANVRGFGWMAPGTSTPLDLSVGGTPGGNGRDRNFSDQGLDQRLDTLMHMQANAIGSFPNGVKAEGVWEIAVPDGSYEVTVAVGDPTIDSVVADTPRHTINVEGQNAINGFQSQGTAGTVTRHETKTTIVNVSDGELTLDAKGGFNTKINYVDISEAAPTDNTPPDKPLVDLAPSSDTGSSSTDNLTKDNTPTFTGEAEAGSTVEVFADGVSLGTATASGTGAYSFTVLNEKALGDRTSAITATATDAAGNASELSDSLNVTVDTAAPAVSITSGPSSTIDQSSATFEFTAEEGSSVACELDGNVDQSCVSPKEYAGLDDGSYAFAARATDGAGNEGSATRGFTVNTPGPGVPKITSPANDSYDTDGDLSISGTAEPDSAIELFEGMTSRGTATADATGDWSVQLTTVTDGPHTYTAKATKNGKTSGESGAITITVDTTDPGAPTNLAAEGQKGAISLDWDDSPASEDVAGYNIYRSDSETGTYSKLNGSLLTASAFNDAPLPDETTRYYQVTAVDRAGNESERASKSATTLVALDETPPGAPTGLSATAREGQVALDWADNPAADGVAGYDVFRATSASGPFNKLNADALTESQYTDTAVQNGTTYHYNVKATDSAGNVSVASSTVSAKPQVQAKCPKRSLLECAQIKKTTPVSLEFSGSESGLADKDGEGIGFTTADPPSARLAADAPIYHTDAPGYEPGKLNVANGKLAITSTKGIMFKAPATSANTNSQLNALGVGVDAAGKITRMETTLAGPSFPSTGSAEQGGIWFGLNEDNYAKLVVFNQGNGNAKIQMLRERDAVANDTTDPATDDQLDSHTGTAGISGLSTQNVKLTLVADAAAGNVTGYYQVGSGAETKLGTLTVPASFFEGTQISSAGAEKATFAGLFDTHRNGSTPVTLNFENFSVTSGPADATAPTVDAVQPEADASDVAIDTNISATFSEAMDASTIGASTFKLEKQGGAAVSGQVGYDGASKRAALDPNENLEAGATYTATVTTGVKDQAGNALGSARTWSFTTAQAGDTQAPGAPTGLAATAGDGQVALNWADNTENDLVGYNVYRGTSASVNTSGTPLNGATPVGKTSSQYTDTTAQNGTTYHYVVAAVDASGNESGASNSVSATPEAQPQGNPLALEFDRAVAGTVNDKDSEGTGFASVQPNGTNNAYDASKLDLQAADGKLVVTATQGTNTARNDLKNALRLSHEGTAPYEVGTRLVGPLTNIVTSAQQGGIYVGPDQDNYVKIVANAANSGGTTVNQIQMFQEVNSTRAEVGFKGFSASEWAAINTLDLFLTVDPAAGTVKGEYAINGGARQMLPTAGAPRPSTSTFTIPSASRASFFNADSKAGILAFTLDAANIPVTFERFEVKDVQREPDTTAPAAPQNVRAAAGEGKVDLAWDTNTEGDVAGYNVYRGTSESVDTSGTPLNASLLEQPSYSDSAVQNGTAYHYVVQAVDTSGNKSGASARVSATPRAATGEQFAAKINFQNAAAPVPTGYFRDYGQAYGARTGTAQGSGLSFGWIDPATKAPLDLSVGGTIPGNGRDRNLNSDQRLDTFMHAQADDVSGTFNGTAKEGAWEIAVPNGTYNVTVAAGDSAVNSDPESHTINVEGTNAISGFVPSGAAGTATHHKTATVTAQVSDGKLTIDAQGGTNTKINYVDVASVQTGPDITAPNAPANVVARAGDGEVSVTWNANTETDLDGYNIYSGTSATGTPLNATLLKTAYHIDRTLTNGTERSYVVEAVDKSGNKAAAQPVSATPQAGATANRPKIISTNPTDGATNVALSSGVAATLNVVTDGVDESTFSSDTVKLIKVGSGTQVPASYGTSGGNDVINLIPNEELEPNTQYRFEVTDGVKDLTGTRFLPYTSTFTTGTTSVFNPPGVTTGDVGNAAFDRLAQPNVPSKTYTSVTMGPDNRLYAGTVSGEIYRFDVGADGNLSNPQVIDTIRQNNNDCNTSTVSNNGCTNNRLIIGLTFEPGSTAENPKLWVTHSFYGFNNMKDWGGKLSVLSGANLGTYRDVLVNLPRSSKDHLTNSIAFKNGKIYIPVGATTAMGAYDNAWKGTERLLSAAVIEVDYQTISGTLDVKTADGGTYNPYASGAPVKIFATGVRNAVDLVWHSNGNLYTPTNGSAGGSNVPATPDNFAQLQQCQTRSDGAYTGPAIPDFDGPTTGGSGSMLINKTQDDYLFRVVRGGYYGNPNPSRCEWVLNGGNPTAGSGNDPGENPAYPAGTKPDRNWRGWAYDFKNNQSPNGAIEYKSSNFGGKLKGKLLVARYSQGDDIIVLEPGANGNIAKQNVGVPGLNKVSGSEDPLDLTEDTRNGNLYVTEGVRNPPDGTGKITLLRARDTGEANPADVSVDKSRLVYNDVQNGSPSAAQTVTVTNSGGSDLTVSGASLSGVNANQFQISAAPTGSVTLTPGQTQQIGVLFNPTSVGPKGASLDIASNDTDTPVAKVNLRGLGTLGTGGANEPSLQWILDTYEIPVNVGDPNAADNSMPTSALLGDEIAAESFERAYAGGDVSVEPLAVFGPQDTAGTVTRVGDYASGQAASKQPIFSVANAGYQSLNPTTDAKYDFTPAGESFGFYSVWPFFNGREVFSEDSLNTWEPTAANRHKVRVYPLKNKDGSVEQNAYIVATEEHTSGYDYQDVVYIVRNAKPVGEPAPDTQEIDAPNPKELVFSGVKGSTSIPTQSVSVKNSGTTALEISGASVSGTNAGAFQLVNPGAKSVPAGQSATFEVKFVPGSTAVGSLSAKLTIASNDADEANVDVGLYGLSTNGEQGSNEPTLQDVVNTLGYPFKAHSQSGNPLTFGTDAGLKGDEVTAQYFRKAGSGNVTIKPIARYSPDEALPFGWYTGATKAEANERTVATIAQGQMQTLNPKIVSGGGNSFDPGTAPFGVFTNSETNFKRKTYQNDAFNVGNSGGVAHAARVYSAKDRAGQLIANTYVVTFEDASNGDYQDYVFLLTNVKPSDGGAAQVTQKFNFQPERVDDTGRAVATGGTVVETPEGYTKDNGAAYDAARGYGWIKPDGTPEDLSLNGRLRTSPSDPVLRTLIIMQGKNSSGVTGTATNPVPVAWERDVANGTYVVKVGVGDSAFFDGTDGIKVENTQVIPNAQRAASQTHLDGTAEVTVTDGKLTLLTTGTNTKLNYVEVTGDDTSTPPPPPPPDNKKINFQPDAATVPTGYVKDAGLGFDATRGYGWVQPGTSNPVNISAQTRERNLDNDQRLDTLIIMQPGLANQAHTPGAWEYALPSGQYEVTMSAGDPGFVDSTHRINVEGVNAINNFVPTNANKFANATVTANVTDGRLTIDATGGDQTKLNYVEIVPKGDAEPDTAAPTVSTKVEGTKNTAGAYLKRATITVSSNDNEGGSGVKSVAYSINGGEFKPYTGPVDVTQAGEYTVVARATDNAGNEATSGGQSFTVVVPPPGKGNIEVENLDGVPFPDRLVFNRIQKPEEGTTPIRDGSGNITGYVAPNSVHDVSTLRVKNTGVDPLSIEGLNFDKPSEFKLDDNVALPAVVKPGESLDVPVRFVYSKASGTSEIRTGTLTVVSDDADEPEKKIELAGFWQEFSEQGREANFGQMVSTFGYGTAVPTGASINTEGKLMAQGDEILSPYWKRADATKQVTVRQLAAAHTQGNTASFGWTAKNTYNMTTVLTHVGVDGQSFLPRKNDANRTPGVSSFTPSQTVFGFRSDPEHSDYAVNTAQGRAQIDYDQGCVAPCGHHFRTWPAIDREGRVIPNAYLMTMDYAGINYDFQDNVYLVTNIKPENDALDPAAPAPLPGAPALKLEFDKDYTGTLADKNGVGTGFKSTQPNKNDITVGSDSYKKEFLEMGTAAPGTLAVTTSGTTNGGATNGLVNGLRLNFDGSGGEYTMSTRLVGPLNNLGTGQGGVMFGSDQDNFSKVNAINRNNVPSIEFFVERGGNNSATSGNGTIGTVAIPNGGNVSSLDLYLIADKAAGKVRAAYRVDDGALAAIPGEITLTSSQMGRFFAEQAKAGIIAHHGTATNPPVTVKFDRFAITQGTPDPAANGRNALYRLDTGTSSGFTYTDKAGNAWTSDAGFYTPSTAINEGNNTDTIDNTEDDALYRTYRGNVGNVAQAQRVLTYNLPTNGAEKLDVRLHFAERAWLEAGKRLFDIEVEGKAARKNFDIFAAAGGKNAATVLSLDDVAVTDGSLTLALRASLDYPAISGIEVLCEGTCPDPDKTAPAAPSGLSATPSDAGIALDWENNRESDVAGYNVYRSGSATGTFTKLNSTLLAASQYNDAAAAAGTASFYKVEAVDASGNVSGAATASATRPAATQGAIRINAGGTAQTVGTTTWSACSSLTACSNRVTGGGPFSEADTNTGIPANMNNAIFQSEWTGGRQGGIPAGGTAFSFNIPVQPGDYQLRLHFAELNKTATGARVFDVNVEGGDKELVGFDVFKEAGGINKAIVREFPTTVTDSVMNIDFIAQVENAKISAVEILPTTAADKEAPASPSSLSATASQAGIGLDWADNTETDLAGYNVYRSDMENGPYTKLNGSPLSASAYSDGSVNGGKTYFYKVTAVDKSGNESVGATDSATVPAASAFSTITWTNTNQSQPQSNSEGQSEVVGGKLYSFGGFDSNKPCCTPTSRAYSYTPATGWARIANMPAQNGTAYGGVTHAGFTNDGEDIFWAGGYTSNGNGTGQIFGTKEVWKYDVSSDKYSRLKDLPVERAGGQLEYLNGKLYYFGGTNLARTLDVGNLYVLDLSNPGASWTELAAMPNGRHHLASAVVGGKIYAIGGQKGHDDVLIPQADVHRYDPATNGWAAMASMPKGINHASSATVVMGGRILVVGGQTNHGTGVADVNAYNPTADSWSALTPLPVARHSGVAGVLGGNIYFSTGGSAITYKGVPGADTTAPKVAGVQPAENATGVALSANVVANFDEAMDAASLTGAGNFTLTKAGETSPVAASVTVSGNKATLNPNADLAEGAEYTATVKGAAKDAAGNALGADKTWTFTTAGGTPPPAAPSVRLVAASDSGSSNSDGITNVVRPTFEGTAEAGTSVEVFNGTASLGTATTNSSGNWSLAATGNIADGTHTVTAKATRDSKTSAASAGVTVVIDTAAPDTTLASSGPSGTVNSASAEFTFSSENGAAFECKLDTGSYAACTSPKSYSGLQNGQRTFSVRAIDKAGNADASPAERAWMVDVDTTAPTVQSASPQTDARDVELGTNVTAVFSEAMKESTINGSNFVLSKGATNVAATVTYDATTKTATLDPSADLEAGAVYTATVTTGVQDTSGNALATTRTWSFTTIPPADTTPPAAPAITSPANNSYDNDGNLTFSGTAEAGSSVELFEGTASRGKATAGTGGNWSIQLAGVADGSHTYAAKATDAAGNTSVASGNLTVTVDKTAPAVSGRAPQSNATGVAVGANVTATFNDDMAASTVDGTSFKLTEGTSTTTVAAAVSYDAQTKTATLDPGANLKPGTPYSATVTAGVKDKAGNPLAAAETWTFTTAASTQPTTKTALLVVGSTSLNAADSAIRQELVGMGYTVTVQSASATNSAAAGGKSLVLISSTVSNSAVGTKFRNVTTPVVAWENVQFGSAYLGMSSSTGRVASQSQVSIVNASHPLAGGLTAGNKSVLKPGTSISMGWAATNANAQKIATIVGNANRATVFGYEKGVQMPGLNAPARRVGLFPHDTTAPNLNANGWTLFRAAVGWAAEGGGTTTPPPTQQAVRIDAGGPGQTVGGVSWRACSSVGNCSGYLTGGFQYGTTNAITGVQAPANQALYQTEWTGGQTNGVPAGATAFKFDVPVENGSYNVRLHFAELAQNGIGKRVFDVNVEGGAKELAGFDVFAEAGGMYRAIVREFPTTVTDGSATIEFIRQVENAKISGIEIIPIPDTSGQQAVQSTLSLDANRSTLTFGQTATLSGTLSTIENKELANRRVVLEERPAGEGPFAPVDVSTTNANGAFDFPVQPRKNPDYRVSFAGDGKAEPSSSPSKSIEVGARVTSDVSPGTVRAGRQVLVSGKVLPASQGQDIEVTIRRGSTVVEVKTLKLDANSAYRFAYKTGGRGTYSVVASYAGDTDKLGGDSRATTFRVTR